MDALLKRAWVDWEANLNPINLNDLTARVTERRHARGGVGEDHSHAKQRSSFPSRCLGRNGKNIFMGHGLGEFRQKNPMAEVMGRGHRPPRTGCAASQSREICCSVLDRTAAKNKGFHQAKKVGGGGRRPFVQPENLARENKKPRGQKNKVKGDFYPQAPKTQRRKK